MAQRKKKRSVRDLVIANAGKEVKLSNGEKVLIKPWGVAKGDQVLPIVADLAIQIVQSDPEEFGDLNIHTFLLRFKSQIDELLQLTLGWSDEQMQMEGLLIEDKMALTSTFLEVCVIREDGGGPLGEFLRLSGQLTPVLRTVFNPIQPAETNSASPSERSSRAATRSPKSPASSRN